jgi:hypothetical protein
LVLRRGRGPGPHQPSRTWRSADRAALLGTASAATAGDRSHVRAIDGGVSSPLPGPPWRRRRWRPPGYVGSDGGSARREMGAGQPHRNPTSPRVRSRSPRYGRPCDLRKRTSADSGEPLSRNCKALYAGSIPAAASREAPGQGDGPSPDLVLGRVVIARHRAGIARIAGQHLDSAAHTADVDGRRRPVADALRGGGSGLTGLCPGVPVRLHQSRRIRRCVLGARSVAASSGLTANPSRRHRSRSA